MTSESKHKTVVPAVRRARRDSWPVLSRGQLEWRERMERKYPQLSIRSSDIPKERV